MNRARLARLVASLRARLDVLGRRGARARAGRRSGQERPEAALEDDPDQALSRQLLLDRGRGRAARRHARRVHLRAPQAARGLGPERDHRDRPHRPDRQRQRLGERAALQRHQPQRDGAGRHVPARRRRRLVPRARHARVHARPSHRSHHRHPGAHQQGARQDARAEPGCSRTGCSKGSPSSRRAPRRAAGDCGRRCGTCGCAPTCSRTTSRRSTSSRPCRGAGPRATSGTCTARSSCSGSSRRTASRPSARGSTTTAAQIIPYAMNRSMRRATGRTFEQLYVSWVDSMKRELQRRRPTPSARAAFARACASPTRATRTSTRGGSPPTRGRTTRGTCSTSSTTDTRPPASGRCRCVRDGQGHVVGSRESDRELVIRTNGVGSTSFMPDGTAVFSGLDVPNNLFFFDDLVRAPRAREEPARPGWQARALDRGLARDRSERLPRRTARRLHDEPPRHDVPDDCRHRTSPTAAGDTRSRTRGRWYEQAPFDQAFTPRWSPDNRHVAYSSWIRGGYRDVRIVDTRDGSYVEVTHDRAIDGDPSYSADGKLALLPLGPHRRDERLRVRGRHGTAHGR